MVQIDKNVFKQVCMKNLDLGVCEHSPSAATTSQTASAQEMCDPFQAATGSSYSGLFGAWILLRPARNLVLGLFLNFTFPSKPLKIK